MVAEKQKSTQPVLQHVVGISTWPDHHAMYFEALRVVVSHDKPTVYELADDLKQIVKPELTGPCMGNQTF
ncbi:hypothetical protein Hdeb2414_s0586g00920071 [Helianthus debilis subsp. tardiflorus]